MTLSTKGLREKLGEPVEQDVIRDGDRDLVFDGWMVGEGEQGSGGTSGHRCDWNRITTVRIYATVGGRIVTHRERSSSWQGEGTIDVGSAHDTPAAALAWLREDCGGQLGTASKEAWQEACYRWDAIEDERDERVA